MVGVAVAVARSVIHYKDARFTVSLVFAVPCVAELERKQHACKKVREWKTRERYHTGESFDYTQAELEGVTEMTRHGQSAPGLSHTHHYSLNDCILLAMRKRDSVGWLTKQCQR